MSIDIPMRREGSHLVPADAVSAEMMAEVPTNTGVMVTVKVPRNLRQFRLAWALADIVSKSCDWLTDRESAMDWIKIKCRHVRIIHDPLRGITAIVPKSISFASLDQIGFARLLSRMIYVTTTEIIPGLEEGALRAELENIVGIDTAPIQNPDPVKPKRGRPRKVSQDASPQAEAIVSDPLLETIAPIDAPAAQVRSAPTNEAEYLIACRGWIKKQTDHAMALEYLDSASQIELRAACKLSIGANKMIRRELATHIESLKKEMGAQ